MQLLHRGHEILEVLEQIASDHLVDRVRRPRPQIRVQIVNHVISIRRDARLIAGERRSGSMSRSMSIDLIRRLEVSLPKKPSGGTFCRLKLMPFGARGEPLEWAAAKKRMSNGGKGVNFATLPHPRSYRLICRVIRPQHGRNRKTDGPDFNADVLAA
jgi:hypothetical protein